MYKPSIDLSDLDGPLDSILFNLRVMKGLREKGLMNGVKGSVTRVMDQLSNGEPYPLAWIEVLGDGFEYSEKETIEGY